MAYRLHFTLARMREQSIYRKVSVRAGSVSVWQRGERTGRDTAVRLTSVIDESLEEIVQLVQRKERFK